MPCLAIDTSNYWVGLWAFLHTVAEDVLHGLWMTSYTK